jgi:hypothetical protein
VINSIRHGYFDTAVETALRVRKERTAEKQNQFIDLDNRMLELIKSSNH